MYWDVTLRDGVSRFKTKSQPGKSGYVTGRVRASTELEAARRMVRRELGKDCEFHFQVGAQGQVTWPSADNSARNCARLVVHAYIAK